MKPFKDYAYAFQGEYNFDIISEVEVIPGFLLQALKYCFKTKQALRTVSLLLENL